MNCPSCKDERVLVIKKRIGIEIDYCPECRGVWLDSGELNKIIKKSQRERLRGNLQNQESANEIIYYDTYNKIKEDFKNKKNKSFLEELFG